MHAVSEREGDVLLKMPQIAELTGVPEGTLRYYRHIGKGPNLFKPGRELQAYKSDVLAWLRDREAATQTQANAS